MIVDDRRVIIGSANINDRSMLGSRDTEICCVIEQSEVSYVSGIMNGIPTKISPFARDLRIHIWKTFLGIKNEKLLNDPIADSTFSLWKDTSANNTKLYKTLFPRLPDNIFGNVELRNWVHWDVTENWDNSKEKWFKDESVKISGILVDFPIDFLKDVKVLGSNTVPLFKEISV